MGIGLNTRYSEHGVRRVFWSPGLVLMRLFLMADVARRLEAVTVRPAPMGHRCSLPPPPAGRDWEGKNAYGSVSTPLLPVPPSEEERRLQDETVQWLRELDATDRVIVWGGAAEQSFGRIAAKLRKNEASGCKPMSRDGVRKRWFRLLELLAMRWGASGYEVDVHSRARLEKFDSSTWMVKRPKPHTKGRAYVNGKERPAERIEAAEVDQVSMQKTDVYFSRQEWQADAPKVGRDGQVRVRKNAVDKVVK